MYGMQGGFNEYLIGITYEAVDIVDEISDSGTGI